MNVIEEFDQRRPPPRVQSHGPGSELDVSIRWRSLSTLPGGPLSDVYESSRATKKFSRRVGHRSRDKGVHVVTLLGDHPVADWERVHLVIGVYVAAPTWIPLRPDSEQIPSVCRELAN